MYYWAVIAAQRRNLILDAIEAEGAVSITALAARLHISAVTIRRDLDHLDSVGKLTRTHGGAIAGAPMLESPYSEKAATATSEKHAIGRLAATLVSDGAVVVIGPGTTTEQFALNLVERNGLTIVTNSLLVVQAFINSPGNQVIMTGGILRAPILALVGDATNRTFRGIHADLTFLSGNGLDADFGLSTPNMTVADADRAAAAAGNRVVVLADHTKFATRAAIQTVPADRIAHLVTDPRTPRDVLDGFSRIGVEVQVSGNSSGLLDTV